MQILFIFKNHSQWLFYVQNNRQKNDLKEIGNTVTNFVNKYLKMFAKYQQRDNIPFYL